jgi:hypothetical protein
MPSEKGGVVAEIWTSGAFLGGGSAAAGALLAKAWPAGSNTAKAKRRDLVGDWTSAAGMDPPGR